MAHSSPQKGTSNTHSIVAFFPPFNVAAASSVEQEKGLSMKYVVISIAFACYKRFLIYNLEMDSADLQLCRSITFFTIYIKNVLIVVLKSAS